MYTTRPNLTPNWSVDNLVAIFRYPNYVIAMIRLYVIFYYSSASRHVRQAQALLSGRWRFNYTKVKGEKHVALIIDNAGWRNLNALIVCQIT